MNRFKELQTTKHFMNVKKNTHTHTHTSDKEEDYDSLECMRRGKSRKRQINIKVLTHLRRGVNFTNFGMKYKCNAQSFCTYTFLVQWSQTQIGREATFKR